jgi:hypothetical protein
MVVPVVLTVAVSFVRPMFMPRYLIICVPALILFGASPLARLRRPPVVGVLVVTLVWLSASHLFAFYQRDAMEDWRDATRYVLAATHPGDVVAFFPPYASKPFQYYQRLAGADEPTNLEGRTRPEGQRTWLVIRESDAAARLPQIQQLQSSLTYTNRLADRHRFFGVGVELYVPK